MVKLQSMRDMGLIEEERRRIAADLHDDLGCILANIRISLESIHKLLPGSDIVPRTLMHLDLSLGRVREISHNLVPRTLSNSGLAEAVAELAEEFESPNMKIVYKGECTTNGLLPSACLIVYRVLQEIVTNAVKHSEANEMNISCQMNKSHLILDIKDNGIGFIPSSIPKHKQFGLQSIRSRLQVLDAEFKLTSSLGTGTHYLITIPISSLELNYEI